MPSRILIIDDAPANIQTLSSILKARGYNINIATNGRQGLEVLERIRPDLILLDIMMPEMDGFETCQRIKASTAWREIPIVFLTAKTDTADIVRAFELGAVDYVPKPFNAHELLARVNTHLTLDHLLQLRRINNQGFGRRGRLRFFVQCGAEAVNEGGEQGRELLAQRFQPRSVGAIMNGLL